MADYHAVLLRTLSGFSEPKPELRFKLYDRARTTIARQLENRSPAVTGDALTAELDKLEYAIFQIEREYDPDYPEPVLRYPPPAEAQPEATEPAQTEPSTVQDEHPPIPLASPPPESAPASAAQPSFSETLANTPAAAPEEAPQVAETATAVAVDETQSVAPPPEFQPLEPPTAVADAVDTAVTFEQQAVNDAAVDQWAEEFLSHPTGSETDSQPAPPAMDPAQTAIPPEPTEIPLPAEVQHPQPAENVEEPNWPPIPQADLTDPAADQHAAYPPTNAAAAVAALPEFEQSFDASSSDELEIPPAPGFGSGGNQRQRKSGALKWVLITLAVVLVGVAGVSGWIYKEVVFEKIGMSDLLDDPTRPKPVKTITIIPEVEVPEESISPPKVESRLNAEGEEVAIPAATTPVPPTLQPVIEPPTTEPPTNGTLPIAQDAILYEEGATAADNTVDAGRVVWSVIEEEPASGAAKEPAIQAKIEIPGRNVVLIMKIKRNADKALPASHLIELVFAVPDDFSGGAVGQVSRFVLKQSEQGRGEGLVGVPARIADGIFLIALNNLDQARTKNESLLKSRDWIDIPLQYRTGRRALMTIEKGVPGAKVFDEVFEAWSKL